MNYRRIVAAGITCAVLLSLPVSVLAVRKGSGGPKAAGELEASQIVPVVSHSLSFDQIENRILLYNPNVQAVKESLAQAKAMNWDKVISDMDDTIDEMEDMIASLKNNSAGSMGSAVAGISQALSMAQDADEAVQQSAAAMLAANVAQISAQTTLTTYSAIQVESLNSTLETLEDQREDLIKQRDDYPKTIEDIERSLDATIDGLTSTAQTFYLNILSLEHQRETAVDSLAAIGRQVERIDLLYEQGNVSQQTVTQLHNAYDSTETALSGLDNALVNLRATLQSFLGAVPDGNLTLTDTPEVTQANLDAIRYDADLLKGKEKSYSLYSAARSVEKARDEMEEARKKNGTNSYQYQMAEHAYQSAVYQQAAAIASFELCFKQLYQAIAPARSTLAVKESDLAYQEQVFAAAELKYQQGNISAYALQDARDTLEIARRDADAARLDLFTAYHTYRLAADKGLISSGS